MECTCCGKSVFQTTNGVYEHVLCRTCSQTLFDKETALTDYWTTTHIDITYDCVGLMEEIWGKKVRALQARHPCPQCGESHP
jgi:hypothetical protein